MKKSVFLIGLICLIMNVLYAQNSITLKFTGAHQITNAAIPLTRVEINNISRGWTEVLHAPDTTLVLTCTPTGIADNAHATAPAIQVFATSGEGVYFDLALPTAGQAQVEVMDMEGRRVLTTSQFLDNGTHRYHLQLPAAAMYVVKATTAAGSCATKVVNTHAASARLALVGQVADFQGKNTQATTTQPFALGDVLQYVGYAIVDGVSYTSATILQPQNADETLVLRFNLEVAGSYFSVDNGVVVAFAPGNLQYQASTNTWRFAENQWDFVGGGNSAISATNSGWIDLFGWGTSGWNCGSNYYQPYDNATGEANSEQYGPVGSNNLTDIYANSDWGMYATIGNYEPGTWRTLTKDEWRYLTLFRSNASLLCSQATVNDVYGFVILPDNWEAPVGITFTGSAGSYLTNIYEGAVWQDMEAAGAIFLPAAGRRNGTSWEGENTGGYWSSTYSNDFASDAYYFLFNAQEYDWHSFYRSVGRSVRLVRGL